MQIPKRITLVSQTAEVIRQEAAAGRWREFLPGERQLAEELQVSRITLRTALQQLRREGLIKTQGQRHCLCAKIPARAARRRTTVVAYLTTVPLHQFPLFKLSEFAELQRLMQQAGLRLELVVEPRLADARSPAARLRERVAATNAACWVLSQCHLEIQRWFMEQPVPAIVTGSRHEGIQLPAVDFDNRAIARHAAGILFARGHRRVALVLPDSGLAGDLATEQGFREACARGNHADIEPLFWLHDGAAAGICRVLNPILTDPRPTALIVSHVQHIFTVVTQLLTHGLRVPQDVSLLCLRSDPDLAFLVPSIACYETTSEIFARNLARLVIQFAATGSLRSQQTLIVASLHAGQSLAALRVGASK